jgi:hypothetical protein
MTTKKTLTCNYCKRWSVDCKEKNWHHRLGGHQRHCQLATAKTNQLAVLRALQRKGSSHDSPPTPEAALDQDDLPSSPPLYWHEDHLIPDDNYESVSAPREQQTIPVIQPVDEMTFLRKPFVVDERTDEFCKVSLSTFVEDSGGYNDYKNDLHFDSNFVENKYYDVQQRIVESFPGFNSMSNLSLSTIASCLLNDAIVKNDLSANGADLFLDAFKDILEEAGLDKKVLHRLPLSMRSLKRHISQHCPDVLSPLQYSCKIRDILGCDIRGEAVGWYFDIMTVLADELLHLNDFDIHLEPVKESVTSPATDHDHRHCFRSSFASGLVFEEMTVRIRCDYDDSTICLPIAVSVDDTAFGGLRNRSSAPVYIKILTVKEPLCWKEEHIRLIGFCPRLNVRRIANL